MKRCVMILGSALLLGSSMTVYADHCYKATTGTVVTGGKCVYILGFARCEGDKTGVSGGCQSGQTTGTNTCTESSLEKYNYTKTTTGGCRNTPGECVKVTPHAGVVQSGTGGGGECAPDI